MSLYHKYRPKDFDEVVGQESVVKTLKAYCEADDLPNVLLFSGSTGTGKTTLARILASKLGCKPGNFNEVNCASLKSPKEYVDSLEDVSHYRHNFVQIFLLDEFQSLSRSGFSQQSLLKPFEDTPAKLYFFLCATDDSKINAAIKNRCTRFHLSPVNDKDMKTLLSRVCKAESRTLNDKVALKICEVVEGSPRQALVLLEKVLKSVDIDKQLDAVRSAEIEAASFDLVKALMPWQGKPKWADVTKILLGLDGKDAMEVRALLRASAKAAILKGKGDAVARGCHVIRQLTMDASDSIMLTWQQPVTTFVSLDNRRRTWQMK